MQREGEANVPHPQVTGWRPNRQSLERLTGPVASHVLGPSRARRDSVTEKRDG